MQRKKKRKEQRKKELKEGGMSSNDSAFSSHSEEEFQLKQSTNIRNIMYLRQNQNVEKRQKIENEEEMKEMLE